MRISPLVLAAHACTIALVVGALAVPMPATAQAVYVAPSTTGLSLGYAHRYSDLFASRIELSWLPKVDRNFDEDGIAYTGDAKSLRGTALFDWHPLAGGFRLTAGLSLVNAQGTFSGAPISGSTITIGSATVTVGPADRYDVTAELPSAMPYLGLGWGGTQSRGWGLHADLGVLIGSATIGGTLSPSLRAKIALTGRDPDAELARELQTIQDGAAKINVVPVISVGASYRW
ncbi:MAG: hypothetical protein ACOYLX_06980 [Burkholderiaceae bacterium]